MFKHVRDSDAPILDFGCGTGLSGLALKCGGFTTIDGMDRAPKWSTACRKVLTAPWLRECEEDTAPGCGKTPTTPCRPIGELGAAPASTRMLMKALPKGGLLGLSSTTTPSPIRASKALLTNGSTAAPRICASRSTGRTSPA
ncbi:MAG: hypothetical protein ACE368_08595 [Paracoccaceae bacterium]